MTAAVDISAREAELWDACLSRLHGHGMFVRDTVPFGPVDVEQSMVWLDAWEEGSDIGPPPGIVCLPRLTLMRVAELLDRVQGRCRVGKLEPGRVWEMLIEQPVRPMSVTGCTLGTVVTCAWFDVHRSELDPNVRDGGWMVRSPHARLFELRVFRSHVRDGQLGSIRTDSYAPAYIDLKRADITPLEPDPRWT